MYWDLVIDGSYSSAQGEIISCGVVLVDENGFLEEKQFQRKHIKASSTIAEWFALEKAIDEIIRLPLQEKSKNIIKIYTDYINIVSTFTKNSTGDFIRFQNVESVAVSDNYLRQYIFNINKKLINTINFVKSQKCIQLSVELVHIKDKNISFNINHLHKRSHDLAYHGRGKTHEKNGNSKIRIEVKFEKSKNGKRKWVLRENGKELYRGQLKKIINTYQKENNDIRTLYRQNKLELDKYTMQLLKKYIHNLVA